MNPETLLMIVLVVALTLYTVLGGADFGAGIWQLVTAFHVDEDEREHVYHAIGPVWEANHVWLIFVLMILFNGFPVAFAAVSKALWFPLLLAVWGIIFRGAGYAFRSYTMGGPTEKTLWEWFFALASTATPIFLGAAAGAIASGSLPVDFDGSFRGSVLTGWISALSVFNAVFTASLCAYLSAVYLVREADLARDEKLVTVWRRRALRTGWWMGGLSALGLVLVWWYAPQLTLGFQMRGWPFVLLSVAGGITSLWSLKRSRFTISVGGAAVAVSGVMLGWGAAQFPWIVPPAISVSQAAAPANVLWMMLGVISVGVAVLLPSLGYLFWLFKSQPSVR